MDKPQCRIHSMYQKCIPTHTLRNIAKMLEVSNNSNMGPVSPTVCTCSPIFQVQISVFIIIYLYCKKSQRMS